MNSPCRKEDVKFSIVKAGPETSHLLKAALCAAVLRSNQWQHQSANKSNKSGSFVPCLNQLWSMVTVHQRIIQPCTVMFSSYNPRGRRFFQAGGGKVDGKWKIEVSKEALGHPGYLVSCLKQYTQKRCPHCAWKGFLRTSLHFWH